MSNIRSNVEVVRTGVAAAARRAGRRPEEVTIVAVSKTRSVEEVREAVAAGLTDFGENRVQELKEKWSHLQTGLTWHLIGSLQTNKARSALEMANLIHSVDREALVLELAKAAERLNVTPQVLIQVNVSGEESKHGIDPEGLPDLLRQASATGRLEVRGLMTMAPLYDDPELARPHFRRLRELAGEMERLKLPRVEMRHLSMGMSGDYLIAVEEGATLVRVGTALFGSRQ